MAKIINQLLRKIGTHRVNQLEYRLDFVRSYIPIYEEKKEKQKDLKHAYLKEKHHKILLPLEMDTLKESDYVSVKTEDYNQKLNKKKYWKTREIEQKFKRKADHSNDQSSLKEQQEKELDGLNETIEKKKKAYANAVLEKRQINNQKMLKKVYEEKKAALDDTAKAYRKELEYDLSLKLERYQSQKNTVITKLEKKLEKAQDQLQDILKKDKTSDLLLKHLDAEDILKIENLTMMFGGLRAVDDLTFSVKSGEIFGLIGPNGAGKTTVFNCITQFYKPNHGKMYFRNSNDEVILLNAFKVHDVIKQGIVRTFQNVELIWELSVLNNLLVGAHSTFKSGFFTQLFHLYKLKQEEELAKAKALKILDDLDLLVYKDSYPIGLPYGVLKKIELARTLMTKPNLIILDEPAAGLNEGETKELAKTIRKIQKDYGCTIFLVEHDMQLVMDICDTICAISFGKKLAIGTPQQIKQNKTVQEAYLGGE